MFMGLNSRCAHHLRLPPKENGLHDLGSGVGPRYALPPGGPVLLKAGTAARLWVGSPARLFWLPSWNARRGASMLTVPLPDCGVRWRAPAGRHLGFDVAAHLETMQCEIQRSLAHL